MNVITLYDTVADKVKQEQNGVLSISSFNIKLKSACLWLLDYISGDLEGQKPPEPYTTQKDVDYLSQFVTTQKGVTEDSEFPVPENYYLFQNMSVLGSYKDELCGDPITVTGCDTPIELLDSAMFDKRCQTYIKSLKPSIKKPIAKIEGGLFVLNPGDLGSIKLVYVRYPISGEVKVVYNNTYGQDEPDPLTSIDCEFGEWARNLLVWKISQDYAVANRERALTEELQVEGKSSRG